MPLQALKAFYYYAIAAIHLHFDQDHEHSSNWIEAAYHIKSSQDLIFQKKCKVIL